MANFEHQRHKPPTGLARTRGLVLACPQLRSNVNLSRIVRLAGCSGIGRVIACGNVNIDPVIARDAVEHVELEIRRSLPPVIKRLRGEGYQVVALEQTTNSQSLFEFPFQRKTALVIGHERNGVESDVLALVDQTVEIPVYGAPLSYNVATATTMAVYEYCRQFPAG